MRAPSQQRVAGAEIAAAVNRAIVAEQVVEGVPLAALAGDGCPGLGEDGKRRGAVFELAVGPVAVEKERLGHVRQGDPVPVHPPGQQPAADADQLIQIGVALFPNPGKPVPAAEIDAIDPELAHLAQIAFGKPGVVSDRYAHSPSPWRTMLRYSAAATNLLPHHR